MATFGITTRLPLTLVTDPNYRVGCRFLLPEDASDITAININFRCGSGVQAKVAIYTDNNGAPYRLVAQTSSLPITNTDGWNSFPISTGPLPSGYYWLFYKTDWQVEHWYETTTSNTKHWFYELFTNPYTDPYGVSSGNSGYDQEYESINAEYTPAVTPILQAEASPTSQSAQIGQNLTFSVVVSGGTTPYSLQWYVNDLPVLGQTSSSITLTSGTPQTLTLYCAVADSSSPINTANSNSVEAIFTSVTPPTLSALHTSGRTILDVNGKVVVLKGFCVPASGDNWYYRKGTHTADSDFAAIHALGANCVRYAINDNWFAPVDYIYSSDNSITCDDLVDFAANHGLYIILDMHYYKGEGSGSLPTNIQDWINTWIAIAQRYKNSPNVLFELFNEPGGDFNSWRNAAQSCLDAIRNTGAENIVLIDGFNLPSGGGANELLAFNGNWLQNETRTGYARNVIYTVHQYVTGYGASPPSTISALESWFRTKGWDLPLTQAVAPVLVGEFNVQHGDSRDANYDGDTALAVFDNFMKVFDNWGVSYTAWCWIAGPDVNVGWNHEYLLYNDFAVLAQNGLLVQAHLPQAPTDVTLTISATVGGTTNPLPNSYIIPVGCQQSVLAIPDSDYVFDHWELDGVNVGSTNPGYVTMNANHTLFAVFEYVQPPPLPATIQGYVKDKVGNPIAGVTITCDGYADITKIDGTYAFVGIPAKVYTLTITMTGYQSAIVEVDVSVGGTFSLNVTLQPVTPPPIPLWKAVAITIGIITPIAGGAVLYKRRQRR
jgi:aryl-phospho-beta-D-glucosidase BglC (GH1 family)